MNRSNTEGRSLSPGDAAPQHEPAPRPLPLFLELVRRLGERSPEVAGAALRGLARYENAERPAQRPPRPESARVGPACLRDHGGQGPPAILVPSLINPPYILDLDSEVSLADAIAGMNRRVLLLDWGDAGGRDHDITGHVEHLLLPLIESIGEPAALIGYCLGGTMAIAAAQLLSVERVATLAAPWRFAGYPEASRDSLGRIWMQSKGACEQLGAMPMEVLQAAFWSLDPERTVAKFAAFADLPEGSAEARRFVALEDWANRGEPLPCPAARELLEDFFADDQPGRGGWQVGGKFMCPDPGVPVLHCTAGRDRITPAATAPEGERAEIATGHVGMIVGSARGVLHGALRQFLDPLVDPRDRR